jgi:integrase family protein with SAM-like domain
LARSPAGTQVIMMSAMSPYKVEATTGERSPFQLRGPDGAPVAEVNEFLVYLSTCDRSGYTLRSYAAGLAHFFGWLKESQRAVDDVSRHIIGRYIEAFSSGPKTRACVRAAQSSQAQGPDQENISDGRRAPRTINHRLSLLGSRIHEIT